MPQILREISKLYSATNLGEIQFFLILQLDPHRTAEKELLINITGMKCT
jgi:hypothetical protein